MERIRTAHRRRLFVVTGAAIAAVVLLRRVLWALLVQILLAAALMLAALPICRALERRLPRSGAAAVSLLMLGAGAGLALILVIPPVARQLQQLSGAAPEVMRWIGEKWRVASGWLIARGIDIAPVRQAVLDQLTSRVGGLMSGVMNALQSVIGSIGKGLLSPLLAFYLLRDRQRIAAGLTLLLPVSMRTRGVRAAREMRRETAAYMRGQLILSAVVGMLTAAGLLLTGTPGWLLLGFMMGVMELVPYVGPVIAGVPAVLLSLQGGMGSALWTLAVLVLVQQLEGAVLSPRLLGGATRLHPMLVLLVISAGGMLAGAAGMVLAIPAVVSVRGVVRGWRD